MMSYLWGGMIVIGIIYAAFAGNLEAVTDAAIQSAQDAVTLCITMMGVMSMWVGLMEIAKEAGIVERLSAWIGPVLRFLFPNVPKGSKAEEFISLNVIANVLGLGWAATPAGLNAMKELDGLREQRGLTPGIATNDMCNFNCISQQLRFRESGGNHCAGYFGYAVFHGSGNCVYLHCEPLCERAEEGDQMSTLIMISNMILPIVILLIVAIGLGRKLDVYALFIKGAEDGFQTVIKIMPTLIGLMVAVGVLRASGFFDFLSWILTPVVKYLALPAEVVPFILIKMFSSSAATGLALDLFKTYGTDSYIGTLVSLSMSSTETVFYTMSVYFMVVKITKTRYTLSGALIATASGVAASVAIALWMCG